MKLTDIPVINEEDIVSRSIEEGIVVIHPNTKTNYLIEDLNKDIWERIDGKRNVDEIIKSLMGEYDAEEEKLKGYVLESLSDLGESGLIRIR